MSRKTLKKSNCCVWRMRKQFQFVSNIVTKFVFIDFNVFSHFIVQFLNKIFVSLKICGFPLSLIIKMFLMTLLSEIDLHRSSGIWNLKKMNYLYNIHSPMKYCGHFQTNKLVLLQ